MTVHFCDAIAFLPLTYSAITDVKRRVIPNSAVLAICACAIAKTLFRGQTLRDLLFGGLGMSAFLVLVTVIAKCDIGGGDIKLCVALGFLFGLLDAIGIFVVALTLMLMHGVMLKEKAMPFAPYALISVLAYEIYLFLCKE